MLEITEIYICRNEQKLSEGHLQYSREIRNRAQAIEDAMELCARDTTIRRVTYYALDDGGEARLMLSYANPGYVGPRATRDGWRAPRRRHAWRPASRAPRRQKAALAWVALSRTRAWLTGLFANA